MAITISVELGQRHERWRPPCRGAGNEPHLVILLLRLLLCVPLRVTDNRCATMRAKYGGGGAAAFGIKACSHARPNSIERGLGKLLDALIDMVPAVTAHPFVWHRRRKRLH